MDTSHQPVNLPLTEQALGAFKTFVLQEKRDIAFSGELSVGTAAKAFLSLGSKLWGFYYQMFAGLEGIEAGFMHPGLVVLNAENSSRRFLFGLKQNHGAWSANRRVQVALGATVEELELRVGTPPADGSSGVLMIQSTEFRTKDLCKPCTVAFLTYAQEQVDLLVDKLGAMSIIDGCRRQHQYAQPEHRSFAFNNFSQPLRRALKWCSPMNPTGRT